MVGRRCRCRALEGEIVLRFLGFTRRGHLPERHTHMTTTTIELSQSQLTELVEQLVPGREVIITRNGVPVARLMAPEPPKGVPMIGRGEGMLVSYTDDDDHLKDFKEYLD